MKFSSHLRSSVVLLAAALHLCNAARVGSLKREDSGWNVTNYEEKEYVRDESKSIVEVITHTNKDRVAKTCGGNERVLNFSFTTDRYGYETSFEWRTTGGVVIASEPSNDKNFGDMQTYSYNYCVTEGQQYMLKMKDERNDGFCCEFGQGTYSYGIGGEILYDSKKTRTFTSVKTHTFRVQKLPSTSQTNNSNGSAVSAKNGGTGCVTVNTKADKNAGEVSWRILNKNGSQAEASPTLKALVPVSKKVCLPQGQYDFVMKDKYGDGICCGSGDGYFTVELDGREIVRGSHFQFEKRFTIQVNPPFERNMSNRDRDWLVAHNERRQKYHREFGASYVPLQWSPQLASQAKRWATKLLDDCEVSGIKHEKGIKEGENLAKNRGSGSYGNLYPADNILTRWVEKERYVGYPRNAHMTQCLWRSTQYLGCGEAVRPFNGGKGTCRIQVCRYARAGNCNMNQHKANIGNNWIKPMIEDRSKCGPLCAPEGCY